MEAAVLFPRSSHRIMDDQGVDHGLGSSSSPSYSKSITNSADSSSSDLMEDATSLSPLFEMSSLMEDLPIKRGLSKHFQGKSQSFTSLASVRTLEDLAKPEGPLKKKLKSCKSHGRSVDSNNNPMVLGCSSRTISKNKTSKCSSSLTSMAAKRHVGFLGTSLISTSSNRPSVAPNRSTSFSAVNTLLFA